MTSTDWPQQVAEISTKNDLQLIEMSMNSLARELIFRLMFDRTKSCQESRSADQLVVLLNRILSLTEDPDMHTRKNTTQIKNATNKELMNAVLWRLEGQACLYQERSEYYLKLKQHCEEAEKKAIQVWMALQDPEPELQKEKRD